MFAKLKKKIEEESQADLNLSYQTTSATPSPRSNRKLVGSPRSSSPAVERRTSASSTDSRDSSRPIGESSEDSVGLLKRKTEQIKRLEIRLQEYYNALQEQLDVKTKLEAELDKQKLLNVTSLEKKDKECGLKINELEKEKLELSKKLQSAKMLNNSFLEKQEVIDELEGFQTQEMAKVKHMFLNCQQELQLKEEKISKLECELGISRSTIERLESENKVFQEKLDKDEIESKKLKDQEEYNLKVIEELDENKNSLMAQVTKLHKELEENAAKSARIEQEMADLKDSYDSLNHSYEISVESSNKTLEEKSCHITHLEDRVKTLEQRLADSSLNGDDRMQAVLTERDNLEKKLEESRQHLMDIKSTWSEKILSLEKQISHLTNKIVEDCQEIQKLEKIAETSQKNAIDHVAGLNEQLEKCKVEINDLKVSLESKQQSWTIEKETLESEIQILRSAKENCEKEFNLAIKKLKEEILTLGKKSESEKENYEKEINELVGLNRKGQELLEEEKRLTRQLKENEIKKDKENESISKKLEEASTDRTEKEKLVNELQTALSAEKCNCEELKKMITNKENELNQIEKGLKNENVLTQQLTNELNECNKEKKSLKNDLGEKEVLLETYKEDVNRFKEELTKTEGLIQGVSDKSAQITELKKLVTSLESELLDRNKTIKLQQQRLGDMKKTLQRELKMQVVTGDVNNGDTPMDSSSRNANMGPSGSMIPRDASQAELIQKLQILDTSGPLFEDVNFRYLKHVILKFMTSREYEAQHLIKAVSVLLHFTPEEERLIRDTLEWKMSWFGSKPKPKFGSGQMAKTISTT